MIEKWPGKPGHFFVPRVTPDETIETIHDITWKNSLPTQVTTGEAPTERETKMLKPSFRYFIIPLGAISTLATLSAQNVAPRAERAQGTTVVREQVVDCSAKSPSEVCVISWGSEGSH
jgi:hypothetical protein